jgi:uncharacterized protein (TIGR03492 family)
LTADSHSSSLNSAADQPDQHCNLLKQCHLLSISNGHGEDLNTSLILSALRQKCPTVQLQAAPLVGAGNAYHRLGIPIVTPIQPMPSGGIFYMNPLVLWQDLVTGLPKLLWQQWQAVKKAAQTSEMILATGDILVVAFAHWTGRPYMAFLVSTSRYYEGKLRLPWLLKRYLRSPRCVQIFTRDAASAEELWERGYAQATFLGYPIMDTLTPTHRDLGVSPDQPMIALLPGSRLPEALENLKLQLQLCQAITRLNPAVQFRAALVPQITEVELLRLAQQMGWHYDAEKGLHCQQDGHALIVPCINNAFADILHQCQLAIGMAGTAVEQAVGLGKPIIQIAGNGPQFTYRFAEAQMRLLGTSVKTMGTGPATPEVLHQAAQEVWRILADPAYLADCRCNGRERVGEPGGSDAIAQAIATHLQLSRPAGVSQ